MFSYRHAFHAGNHADVLKHMVLLHICQYMTQKDKPLTYIDTHAGVGVYQMGNPMAQKSGEAQTGIAKLWPMWQNKGQRNQLPALLHAYLAHVAELNSKDELHNYPGSPYVASHNLREIDRLRIFELHPTDMRLLDEMISRINLPDSRDHNRVLFKTVDGFVGLKANLPPASRRGTPPQASRSTAVVRPHPPKRRIPARSAARRPPRRPLRRPATTARRPFLRTGRPHRPARPPTRTGPRLRWPSWPARSPPSSW